MRPGFVRMQMLQCSTEAAILGKFKCDNHEVVYDNGDNEEPVSITDSLSENVNFPFDRYPPWQINTNKIRLSTVSRFLRCYLYLPLVPRSQGMTLRGVDAVLTFFEKP